MCVENLLFQENYDDMYGNQDDGEKNEEKIADLIWKHYEVCYTDFRCFSL